MKRIKIKRINKNIKLEGEYLLLKNKKNLRGDGDLFGGTGGSSSGGTWI